MCEVYTLYKLIRNASTPTRAFRCSGLVTHRPRWLPLKTSKPGPSGDAEGIGAILSHLPATFDLMKGRPGQLGGFIGQTRIRVPRCNGRHIATSKECARKAATAEKKVSVNKVRRWDCGGRLGGFGKLFNSLGDPRGRPTGPTDGPDDRGRGHVKSPGRERG